MARQLSKTGLETGKTQRRSHQKSRRGCANCKLRRVRCDEEKPKCEKCISYGVLCSYDRMDSSKAGLKFAGEGAFAVDRAKKQQSIPVGHGKAMMLATINGGSNSTSDDSCLRSVDLASSSRWTMSLKDLELFAHFQERTVFTLGAKSGSELYRKEVIRLSLGHTFLQHIVLAIALFHKRHLQGGVKISQETTLHWLKGTAEFKETLMRPVQYHEKDALWATAALLGAIQFAAIEASTPEEAWPLKDSGNDLDWLKMSDGKKAVWAITDPSRPDSAFRGLSPQHRIMMPGLLSIIGSDMIEVSSAFSETFQLGPTSTLETNPYHAAAYTLARLFDIECNRDTLLEFLAFITHISPALKDLIAGKEPKALLLLACWFAKVHRYQWWIHRRGLLQGTAICIFLERHHAGNPDVRRLLEYPKRVFGLSFEDNKPGPDHDSIAVASADFNP